MAASAPPESSRRQRWLAWSVHGLTASGAALALLALDAIARQAWREALLWQLLALAIDGIDGTLARAARVKDRVPRIDGEALDLIVDFLNYVLVPSMLLWRTGALPVGLALPLLVLVQFGSLYVFVRRDMKTEDGYFRGFPALWNVVALYALLLRPDPGTMGLIVLILALASFAPVHVVHPFRTRDYPALARSLAFAWAAATLVLIVSEGEGAAGQGAAYASLILTVAIAALGLMRTARGAIGKRAEAGNLLPPE